MGKVKRIYVEKKASFAVKAKELEEELKSYLGIDGLLRGSLRSFPVSPRDPPISSLKLCRKLKEK